MRLIPYLWDALVPFFIGLFVAYLIGAFIGLSFNPSLWTDSLRSFMPICGMCMGSALYTKLRIGGAYDY